ncbi:MAG: caspase family protein [Saprospiraceae bacterium]|nr:caspase family protein [Saprospiraceae bacterium]
MKIQLVTFILMGLAMSAIAQEEGLTPIAAANLSNSGETFAVVVGISDYQDPGIPDLRFADKDAEAFDNFLRSPAGGSLDGDHLKVLTNQNATAGRIAEALDGLIEQTREGDQVIIYFSGHGDVERKTVSQPGFLLVWDAPSRVYMGGGTYSLAFLQEVVTTLSTQNLAKVVVITDACHAGKLAGSQIGGSQLTSANLAKQYANEVKILSCQPNEYSLEGEQWGEGRGCFSFHLVDGLFGLADRNGDGLVSVGEIDRYLEDHVTAEAAPQSQVPILLGNKTEKLSKVNVAILADLQKFKTGQMAVFASSDSRGLEDEILAKLDSGIVKKYLAFKKAVAEKRFFEPADNCADFYTTFPPRLDSHRSMVL